MIQEIAPHRFDITYRPDRAPQEEDFLLGSEEDRFWLCRAPEGVRFPRFLDNIHPFCMKIPLFSRNTRKIQGKVPRFIRLLWENLCES